MGGKGGRKRVEQGARLPEAAAVDDVKRSGSMLFAFNLQPHARRAALMAGSDA